MDYPGVTFRSFLKWVGGKRRSIKYIMPHIPDGVRFVDVFAGSGTVGLNVALADGSPFKQIVFNDINYDPLDAIYYAMNNLSFAAEAKALFLKPEANTPAFFDAMRREFNTTRRGQWRAILFLYLNRHAYNGLVRYNSDWEFNAPFGKYKRVHFPERELGCFREMNLRSKTTIMEGPFDGIMSLGRADGSVYYCDPPYLRHDGFTGYSGFTFGRQKHEQLAQMALDLSRRGATVLIQNHYEAIDLYQDATEIASWDVTHTVSCVGEGRDVNTELLAIYRPK